MLAGPLAANVALRETAWLDEVPHLVGRFIQTIRISFFELGQIDIRPSPSELCCEQ
jgi:hypothetical protein